jgi:NhaP-type Na+/H+ or K+/H+ antiporter
MRGLLVGLVLFWLASAFYFLIGWDWSPDRFLEWASIVVFFGGIVLGFLGIVFVLVAGIWTGHQEKKQWE